MDKASRINALAQRLQQAGARRDWQGIKRVDAEIAALAAQLAPPPDLSDAERQAVERLRAVHRQVAAQCGAEVKTLGQTLVRINSQQGRWQAYSQSNQWGDSGL
ncbi:hypothetical protein SNE35_23215 [Paucibacter sp. R3-3]|uniref:Flagellar protein FliT n=1 Tax=Roseateles agri TaxID=3098619 RepID=A0ABU5DMC1_9BURK|nr:hypothetical protein [Paucibacter sp. R3-3]MDY0747433.1 hypothetical protein [Paucibacter sp. R3-3]